jgi:hypothetical protein
MNDPDLGEILQQGAEREVKRWCPRFGQVRNEFKVYVTFS